MLNYLLLATLFLPIALQARLGESSEELKTRYKDKVFDAEDLSYYGNKLIDYSPMFKDQLYALLVCMLDDKSAGEIAQLQGLSMKGSIAITLAEELSGVARAKWVSKGASSKQQTFEVIIKTKDSSQKILITMTDWIGVQKTPMVTIYVRTQKFEDWLLQKKKERGEPPDDGTPKIVGAPSL